MKLKKNKKKKKNNPSLSKPSSHIHDLVVRQNNSKKNKSNKIMKLHYQMN